MEQKIKEIEKKLKVLEKRYFDLVDAINIIVTNFDKMDEVLTKALSSPKSQEIKLPTYTG